jgi:hypothetical protein
MLCDRICSRVNLPTQDVFLAETCRVGMCMAKDVWCTAAKTKQRLDASLWLVELCWQLTLWCYPRLPCTHAPCHASVELTKSAWFPSLYTVAYMYQLLGCSVRPRYAQFVRVPLWKRTFACARAQHLVKDGLPNLYEYTSGRWLYVCQDL